MFEFSATHWSQVGRAASVPEDDPSARRAWEAAWEHLAGKYGAAFEFIARDVLRRRGGDAAPESQAEDVVQGFLLACVEKQWLATAAPSFGRFRAFAFTMVRRYTSNYIDAARAQKRHPAEGLAALDVVAPSCEPASEDPAPGEWNEAWLRCLVRSGIESVRSRSRDNAKVVEQVLEHGVESNAEITLRLGWDPERDVALARHRGMKMLREEIRLEVRATVRTAEDEQRELDRLSELVPSAYRELLLA